MNANAGRMMQYQAMTVAQPQSAFVGDGDPSSHASTASGFGWSSTVQANPALGWTAVQSNGKAVGGLTVGTPGLSVSYGDSTIYCWSY